ncbi:MAG: NAD(P)H-dependent flavin oxidoreductase [Dethiobacteria bacterium]
MEQRKLSDILQIKYPIILGGMALVGTAELAAAVSEAGAFGQIGAGGLEIPEIKEEIARIRSLTSKPFGVNIPIGRRTDMESFIKLMKAEKVKAVSLGGGNPLPYIAPLKESGITVMAVVASSYHAVKVAEAGADIIIAEGFEAGGHNSPLELTTLTLLSSIVPRLSQPVVAAGGIVDGKGLAAALCLGAAGVQVGTRFMATKECCAHPRYKEALVKAKETDTVVFGRGLGHLLRVLNSGFVKKYLGAGEKELSQEQIIALRSGNRNKIAVFDGDLQEGFAYAGQNLAPIDRIITAAEVVESFMQEAKEAIKQAAGVVKE